MSFELWHILVIALGYLSVLFAIAYCADRNIIPDRWIGHPVVYVLSLGVFASGWAFYGIITVAQEYGYIYLEYYFGIAVFFFLSPYILQPIYRLCKTYQLSSIADLLTFRFRSSWAGAGITIFMLLALMPLLALQIQVVSETTFILTQATLVEGSIRDSHAGLALAFCGVIILFTVLFGAGHVSYRRHNGLVAAIAFETVIKCIALLIVATASVTVIFDGFDGLDQWLIANPQLMSQLNDINTNHSIRNLLLISFAAVIGMPHMFHMLFSEHPSTRSVNISSWAVPLLLVVISIPVLPILWGAQAANVSLDTDYYVLGIGLTIGSPVVTMAAFIGGMSAASSVIIISTIALASMCLNHLILPFYQPSTNNNIYRWLLWVRRVLIIAIILTGFFCYLLWHGSTQLADLAVSAFSGVLQFLPGLIALLYFPKANRQGFIWGLAAGFVTWFSTLLLPIVIGDSPSPMSWLGQEYSPYEYWSIANTISLLMNVAVMAAVSIYTETSEEEKSTAHLCSLDNLQRPQRRLLSFATTDEFVESLSSALGKDASTREIDRALLDIGISSGEVRPYALRRLRDRIEVNLSGLLGASVAHDMIDRLIPYKLPTRAAADDIRLLEARIESNQELSGVETELDKLRLLHRQTLLRLPIGVCSLDADFEISMWNQAMTELSGVDEETVVGSFAASLPPPWDKIITDFANSNDEHRHKTMIMLGAKKHWLTLHKARKESGVNAQNDQVILIEDVTDLQMLEEELMHSERLASIGRLAAGVAHEIGNPVTGIACLAQNLHYETETEEIKITADDIITQTERISSIVTSLVNFSHGGAHAPTIENSIFSVKQCADEAIKLLSLDNDATAVRFNNCCDNSEVLGDYQGLLQVFVNLLSNARDASDTDDYISIDCHREDDQVIIKVCDAGHGISSAQQEQIFEPFFTTKEPGKGTGLGLALVFSIIENHQGQISVRSPINLDYGSGTEFSIHLPAKY
jgi:Na+/proline symporter/nitrogen-specific signal transduction histidine kinase|tara:strand:+ start:3109 stop:6045 length:2937 start_codon:yes stop_codon:yes gene_type:complete